MGSADGLIGLFQAITKNLQQDREDINALDKGDNDTGDNMVANFELVTQVLQTVLAQREAANEKPDVGDALRAAASQLKENGRGSTAPIYAKGLDEAGERLAGQTTFSAEDLLPLLEGLISGTQKASTAKEGEGSMLDGLIPGVAAFVAARREGASTAEALLEAFLKVRRSANRTARAPQGYARQSSADTRGEVDPGAAGAASVLEGIFGALLESALTSGNAAPAPAAPAPRKQNDLISTLIGAFFGGGNQAKPAPADADLRG